VVFTANGILAPALGGLLVATLGPPSALLLDAGSFVLAARALVTAALPQGGAEAPAVSAMARLRASVGYARRDCLLRRLFCGYAVLTALLAMILPVEVVFVTGTVGASDAAFGSVLTAAGPDHVIPPPDA
jgi:hypothetical protein